MRGLLIGFAAMVALVCGCSGDPIDTVKNCLAARGCEMGPAEDYQMHI